MIPLSDSNPTARSPIVNRVLLLVNLVVWLYTFSLSGDPAAMDAFYRAYAFDWTAFTGALGAGEVRPEIVYPLVAHMFLHGGWLHVIGNMLYLWIFGDNVEERLGSVRYLGFYLLCGIAAAVGQGLIAPAPLVGASGAVAGVLGAYLFLFPGSRVRTLIFLGIFITVLQLPAIVVIGFFIVIQLIDAFGSLRLSGHAASDQVAYFAHLFGFVAGLALIFVLRDRTQRGTQRGRYG